jgi:hypothetical protein
MKTKIEISRKVSEFSLYGKLKKGVFVSTLIPIGRATACSKGYMYTSQ